MENRNSIFLTKIILRNYKSIGYCDVNLGSLTYLVGGNGSGKSNFLDALQLVRDSLNSSLENAINERGGLNEVRRRSSGHPTHFGIRLEFILSSGKSGYFAFDVGALKDRGYEVKTEECVIGGVGKGPFYKINRGKLEQSSETTFPAITTDRLALVAVSGLKAFRDVFDALSSMSFYSLNPDTMKELQKPQEGKLLKFSGENIASVIGHLERIPNKNQITTIENYLQAVVPMVHGIERKQIGPMETLEFRQDMAGAKHPWRFLAQNMSDGTLRTLGILTALFQRNKDYSPTLVGIEEPETTLHPAASTALREALAMAAKETQIIVTSHSPDLLDDPEISDSQILSVISEGGETFLAPLDYASREAIKNHLFSAGELLRLNQLNPDRDFIKSQKDKQDDLFGEIER